MSLIVLEGLDGAGKSTQIDLLQQLLASRGLRYEYLHFPRFDAPIYGELIARFLRGELGAVDAVDPYVVALLYAGDRADAAPVIRRWLDEGKFVILDRYVYSNVAYQCAKSEMRRPASGCGTGSSIWSMIIIKFRSRTFRCFWTFRSDLPGVNSKRCAKGTTAVICTEKRIFTRRR